jgi:hypothetical protein
LLANVAAGGSNEPNSKNGGTQLGNKELELNANRIASHFSLVSRYLVNASIFSIQQIKPQKFNDYRN